MKKILVVNMNYLGDALMTTPVHAALRVSFPTAQIDAIAGGHQGYGAYDVLAGNPDIDNLIVRVDGGFWARSIQLLKTLRAGRYDCVVVLPPIFAYRVAARLAGTRYMFAVRKQPLGQHMSDTMLRCIKRIAAAKRSDGLVLRLPAEAKARVEEILPTRSSGQKLIGINVGASRPQKRWPVSQFQQLLDAQVAAGRRVVLLGGDTLDDHAAANCLSDGASPVQVVDLVGKTTIMELGAVIERCDVVVTADTGAMHMAAALGTPLVAIFGSTDPQATGPYGETPSRVLYRALKCAPCGNHPTCGGSFECLREITAEAVSQAIGELIYLRKGTMVAMAGS